MLNHSPSYRSAKPWTSPQKITTFVWGGLRFFFIPFFVLNFFKNNIFISLDECCSDFLVEGAEISAPLLNHNFPLKKILNPFWGCFSWKTWAIPFLKDAWGGTYYVLSEGVFYVKEPKKNWKVDTKYFSYFFKQKCLRKILKMFFSGPIRRTMI